MVVLSLALLSVAFNIDWLQAQAQRPSDQPRFEVASVKVNRANDGVIFDQNRGGRFTASGYSLRLLIQAAYQVQEFQIVGGPDWIDSERFDVVAKEPVATLTETSGHAPIRHQLMLRSLLEDRFNLAVHRETRERPVYALVPARSDGKLGPQLRASTIDCETARGTEACGTTVVPGFIRVRGRTMAQLATAFSRLTNTGSSLNRLVVDRSGLQGKFDLELRFTPEHIPGAGVWNPAAFGMPAIDPKGLPIFTAVQEQLGLKLDAQRGPVEVLVIDRVERLAAD